MPLIIEDGTQVPSANSYVSIADARVFATFFDLELSADDAVVEQNLIVAYNWLNTLESEFQGVRLSDQDTSTTQTGVYPRSPVYLRGNLIGKNTIPDELIYSQVVASAANADGSILMPSVPSTSGAIKKEQLEGVGTIEYFDGSSSSGDSAKLEFAKSLLEPLLKSALGITGSGLTLVKGYS